MEAQLKDRPCQILFEVSTAREEYDPFHFIDSGDVLYYVSLLAKCAAGGGVMFAVRHRFLLQLSYATVVTIRIS